MTFIERLNDLIKERGITRKELSEHLQIGINQIKYWENKNTVPNKVTQKVIADYFNVSVNYLLGQTDDRQPSKTESAPTADSIPENKKELLDLIVSSDLSNEQIIEVHDYLRYIMEKKKKN